MAQSHSPSSSDRRRGGSRGPTTRSWRCTTRWARTSRRCATGGSPGSRGARRAEERALGGVLIVQPPQMMLVLGVLISDEDARARARQCLHVDARVFNGAIASLQQQPQLRIERRGLFGRDVEEACVETVDVLDQRAPLGNRLARRGRCRIVVFPVPARLGNFAHAVLSGHQVVPEGEMVWGVGQPAAHADDGDDRRFALLFLQAVVAHQVSGMVGHEGVHDVVDRLELPLRQVDGVLRSNVVEHRRRAISASRAFDVGPPCRRQSRSLAGGRVGRARHAWGLRRLACHQRLDQACQVSHRLDVRELCRRERHIEALLDVLHQLHDDQGVDAETLEVGVDVDLIGRHLQGRLDQAEDFGQDIELCCTGHFSFLRR